MTDPYAIELMQLTDLFMTVIGLGAFLGMASSAFPELNGRGRK